MKLQLIEPLRELFKDEVRPPSLPFSLPPSRSLLLLVSMSSSPSPGHPCMSRHLYPTSHTCHVLTHTPQMHPRMIPDPYPTSHTCIYIVPLTYTHISHGHPYILHIPHPYPARAYDISHIHAFFPHACIPPPETHIPHIPPSLPPSLLPFLPPSGPRPRDCSRPGRGECVASSFPRPRAGHPNYWGRHPGKADRPAAGREGGRKEGKQAGHDIIIFWLTVPPSFPTSSRRT